MNATRRDFFGCTVVPFLVDPVSSGRFSLPEYRACIIGDSQKGLYGHSMHRVFERFPHVRVVGLADPMESGRRRFGTEARAERLYSDYREMLEKEKPVLVAITPRWTTLHREYLLACAAIRAHGIIEKPLASDLTEADAMVKAIETGNLKWGIGFNFRALAEIQALRKAVVEEGLIGEVLEIRSRGKEDQRAGGEDLIVLGTHIMDLMRFFLGNPLWVSSEITAEGKWVTRRNRREATEPVGPVAGDCIHARFGFAGGVTGHFASVKTKTGPGGRWGLDLYGTKGVVCVRQNGGAHISLFRSSTWAPGKDVSSWEAVPGLPVTTFAEPVAERYSPIVRDVLDTIGKTEDPRISLQDGRASLEMIQGIYAAHLQSARLTFPLAERKHPLLD